MKVPSLKKRGIPTRLFIQAKFERKYLENEDCFRHAVFTIWKRKGRITKRFFPQNTSFWALFRPRNPFEVWPLFSYEIVHDPVFGTIAGWQFQILCTLRPLSEFLRIVISNKGILGFPVNKFVPKIYLQKRTRHNAYNRKQKWFHLRTSGKLYFSDPRGKSPIAPKLSKKTCLEVVKSRISESLHKSNFPLTSEWNHVFKGLRLLWATYFHINLLGTNLFTDRSNIG